MIAHTTGIHALPLTRARDTISLGDGRVLELEPRGVYWHRHYYQGCPVAYAVDERGHVVEWKLLTADTTAAAVESALWHALAGDRVRAVR